jgi:hypothetical protein
MIASSVIAITRSSLGLPCGCIGKREARSRVKLIHTETQQPLYISTVASQPVMRVLVGVVALTVVSALCGCGSNAGSIRVPNVEQRQVGDAFSLLRRSGFLVSFRSGFSASQGAFVIHQSPAAGAKAHAGAAVSLTLLPDPLGSIVGSTRPMRTYRVPDFVGQQLSTATAWFSGKRIAWDAQIHALQGSSAASLLAAYKVTAQSPNPGTRLRPGYVRYRPLYLARVRFAVAVTNHGP